MRCGHACLLLGQEWCAREPRSWRFQHSLVNSVVRKKPNPRILAKWNAHYPPTPAASGGAGARKSSQFAVFRVCEVTKTSVFTVFRSLGRSQLFLLAKVKNRGFYVVFGSAEGPGKEKLAASQKKDRGDARRPETRNQAGTNQRRRETSQTGQRRQVTARDAQPSNCEPHSNSRIFAKGSKREPFWVSLDRRGAREFFTKIRWATTFLDSTLTSNSVVRSPRMTGASSKSFAVCVGASNRSVPAGSTWWRNVACAWHVTNSCQTNSCWR